MHQGLTSPTWPWPVQPVTITAGPVYVWTQDVTAANVTYVVEYTRGWENVKDGPANRARTADALARMVAEGRRRVPRHHRPRRRPHQQPKLRHVR